MEIKEVLNFNKNLEIKLNNFTDFENLGVTNYREHLMLSYCIGEKYLNALVENKSIVCAFINKSDAENLPESPMSFIYCEDPHNQFLLFHEYLLKETNFYGNKTKEESKISSTATIHPSASIAENNVTIGENVEIAPNVTILENTRVGDNTSIGPNTTIGIDGTSTINNGSRKFYRISHGGGVTIGHDTFIGANSVIVRGFFKNNTLIGNGVTIGNLVNIGHNCVIEDDVMVLPSTVVCGSSTVKSGSRISPGCVISSSKVLGNDSYITLGSVVTKDVELGKRVSGNFAIDHRKFLENVKKIST